MSGPAAPLSLIESRPGWGALLAGIGGFVDAAGFLVLTGLFTAHMSGNSTGLGVALATGNWAEAGRRGFVIPIFVLATALGAAWVELQSGPDRPAAGRSRALAALLTLEAVLLAVFLAAAWKSGWPVAPGADPGRFVLLATAATLAMGFQNAALRRVQSTAAHTTFVTGMLTEFAVSAVRWRLHGRAGRGDEARRARDAAALAGGIWCAYLAGAGGGAWLVSRHGVGTVILPVALLLIVAAALGREAARTR